MHLLSRSWSQESAYSHEGWRTFALLVIIDRLKFKLAYHPDIDHETLI